MIFQGSDAKYYDMSKEELMASIKAFDKAHNWCDACFCGFGMVSIIALFAWGVAVLDTNDREKRAPYRLREDQIAFDSAALKMDNYERTIARDLLVYAALRH